MKVFLVVAAKCDYDQNDSCVMIAESEQRTFEIIEEMNSKEDEHSKFFFEEQYPLMVYEVDANQEQMILASFRAG